MRLNDVCRPRTVLNGPVDRTRNISRLEELPESIWEEVKEPKPGYNYRTEVSVGGLCVTALLDTGATTNAIAEEVVVSILNRERCREESPWATVHGRLSSSGGGT